MSAFENWQSSRHSLTIYHFGINVMPWTYITHTLSRTPYLLPHLSLLPLSLRGAYYVVETYDKKMNLNRSYDLITIQFSGAVPETTVSNTGSEHKVCDVSN